MADLNKLREAYKSGELDLDVLDENQLDQILAMGSQPQEGFVEGTGRHLARTAKDIVVGALEVGDILSSPIRGAAYLAGHDIGGVAPQAEHAIDVATEGLTLPRNKYERIGGEVAKSIGGMGPLGMAGRAAKGLGAVKVGKFLEAGTAYTPGNIAAQGATSAGTQSMLEGGANPLEATLGGVGAGMAPGVAAGLLSPKKVGASILGRMMKVNPAKAESFTEAGMQPSLSEISDSSLLRKFQHATSKVHNTPSEELFKHRSGQLKKTLGIPKKTFTGEESGREALNVAKAREEFKKAEYSELASKVPNRDEMYVDPSHTLNSLNKERAKFKTPEFLDDFDRSSPGQYRIKLEEASKLHDGKVPFNEFDKTRKSVGASISDYSGRIAKEDIGELKHLSSKIDDDMENFYTSIGKHAEWKEAANQWRKFRTEEADKVINPLYAAGEKAAVGAHKKIISGLKSGGVEAELILKAASPEQRKELTSSILTSLGYSKQSRGFSPLAFESKWSDLEPEVQNMLLSNANIKKDKMKSVIEALGEAKRFMSEKNFSNTASESSMNDFIFKYGPGVALGMGSVAGYTTGHENAGNAAFVGLLAAASGAKLLHNPKFVNALAQGVKPKSPMHLNMWLNKVEKSGGNSVLIKGLRKSIAARAEDFTTTPQRKIARRAITELGRRAPREEKKD